MPTPPTAARQTPRLVLLLLLTLLTAAAAAATGCRVTDRQVLGTANQAHGQLKPAVIDDPVLTNYMEAMERRIIDAATELRDVPKSHQQEDASWMFDPSRMKFHFVNSKTINAFTTGGEHMYVYTGLLMACETEDELAAVMCHEYAHVFARHVQQGTSRQYWMYGAAAAGAVAGAALGASGDGDNEDALKYGGMGAGAGLLAGRLVGMGFTREDEHEADKLGFRMYVRAGWDPDRFADFFKKMIALGYDTTPELASDHPTLRSRVEYAQAQAAEARDRARRWRREPVASPGEFERLQARARELARDMPNDNSLEDAQTLLASFSSCVAPVAQPEQVRARKRVVAEVERSQAGQR